MSDSPDGFRERLHEWLEETNADRRVVLLLLVLLLVILGSGLGTFILNLGDDGEAPVTTETPTPTATETPTPDGGGVGPVTPTGPPDDTDTPTDPETPEETQTEITPGPTPTEAPDDDDGDGDGGSTTPTPSGDLIFSGSQQMLSESGVVPGESGSGTVTVESDSDVSAELRITDVRITDNENGITDPESTVDGTSSVGELSEHLEVRIAFEDEDGNVDYVLGTESGSVDLEDLPAETPSSASPIDPGEEMIVRTEWRLPQSTGNLVQSDGVEFDVSFELRSN